MLENVKSRHEWIIARFYGTRKDKVTLVKSRVGIPEDTLTRSGAGHTYDKGSSTLTQNILWEGRWNWVVRG